MEEKECQEVVSIQNSKILRAAAEADQKKMQFTRHEE
jgi:hypothetical protein